MPADKKQVMDVSKPGKTAANATSRPVIVGHGAMMKDPMVNQRGVDVDTDVPDKDDITGVSPSTVKVTVKPLTDAQKAEPDGSISQPNTKDEDKVKDQPAIEDEDNGDDQPVETSEEAIVDAVADQANLTKDDKKKLEEEAAQVEAINKLIENKTYFISVGQVQRRRNNRLAGVLTLLLLLAIVGFYLVIDAGLVKPGFDVPLHFFKQKASLSTDNTQIVTPVKAVTYKTYQDSAKLYTLQYPSDWNYVLSATGGDGKVPDYTKQSHPVIFGKSVVELSGKGAMVQADSTVTLGKSVRDNWKSNNHTATTEQVNGLTIEHVVINFKGDAESYIDDNYLVTANGKTVYITFRQKYYHASPAANWDESSQTATVLALVKSIKIPS